MPGATSRGLSSRRWAIAYLFMYAAYVLIGMTLRLMDWLHGDALVFVQSSRRVVDGSFDLYAILRTPWIAPPLGTTYGYTPLLAIVIAPVVAVSDMLHLGNVWAMKLIGIPLLLLDVVAMQQLRRFAREWRPSVQEHYLFIAIALSLFCTSFLLVTAHKSHPEGLVMLFALLSLRLLPRNLLLSGACAGLALSTKHMTALLLLVPVGVALMMEGRATRTEGRDARRRSSRLRETLDWALLAIGMFAAFMLPAVLRDPTAVQYALVTQAQRIVPLGPGLPRWANTLLETNLNPQTYSEIRPTLLAVSNVPLVIAVVIASLAVAWLLRRRGRPLGIADMRLLGLVAFGGISYLLFAKWVSDGYFQMPLALVALWDILRTTPREAAAHDKGARPFPWVGIGSLALYSTVAHLAPHYARLVGEAPAALATDLFNFTLFTALAVLIIRWAIRVEPEEAQV